jgi:trypsin-like peptidase
MSVRRVTLATLLTTVTAVLFFSMGQYSAERLLARQQAERDARIDALQAQLQRTLARIDRPQPALTSAGTTGVLAEQQREALAVEVKKQLQSEMGLMPVQLLRSRRESFVELYAYDNQGKTNYGTAGYLGQGYFITVKHGVVPLPDEAASRAASDRKIETIRLSWGKTRVNARVIDAGDANIEVHSGDWAILKVDEEVDLPPLRIRTDFAYDFAEPIFRLGNDYSKGIILSTGYVGQRTGNGLVTCLTDGHPGVSGGGVLNQDGDLVGIPIGRMQGDYRFSFILPVRAEMFRKIPQLLPPMPSLEPVPQPGGAIAGSTPVPAVATVAVQ